jgi:hypothetical protein
MENNISKAFYESQMFTDIKSEAQAVVKIQAGAELDIGPFASMQGVDIIQGKLRLNAGLQASLIKKSGKYNYKILEHTDKVCSIEFFEKWDTWQSMGVSTYTMAEAQLAGLAHKDVWKKHPKNMLFARALSNGAKWYCPDIFGGAVYNESDDLAPVVINSTGIGNIIEAVAAAKEAIPEATVVEPYASEEVLESLLQSIANCKTLLEIKDIAKAAKDAYNFTDAQREVIKAALNARKKELV